MISLKNLTKLIVAIALFMDVLDSNILNTAIPIMAHSFHVNPIDVKIALISYLLSMAIFIPASGWFSDKYGSKPIFIGALGLFTFSSLLCGYSETLMQLVVLRFLQGIGGAFMVSLGRLIIARTFQRSELVQAMATIIMVVSVGVMVGPFVGGFIVMHLSWHWIFWVNIPVGMMLIILAWYGIHEETPKNPRPFDFLGFILFGGSLSLGCFSLSELSESSIHFEKVILKIIIALLMMVIYFFYAKRKTYPIIRLELLKIKTFRISVLGNMLGRLGFGGMPFLLPLMQQLGLGFSPQVSGLLLTPIAFGIIFSKVFATKLLRKMGYRNYLLINTILVAMSLWSFQFISHDTSVFMIASLTFIFGIFMSAQYTGMNSLAFADIDVASLSFSTSITSTVQMISQSIGVAAGAILLKIFSPADFTMNLTVFHHAFLALGVITLLSSVMFYPLKKEDGIQMLK